MTKDELIEHYQDLFAENEKKIQDHIKKYGDKICDNLLILRYKQQYYYGALTALNQVDYYNE